MFTGVLKHRTREVRDASAAAHSSEELLTQLLRMRTLRAYRFVRDCEIGPFVVDQVCPEHALAIDVSRAGAETHARNQFLISLGYRVLNVSRHDLQRHPERVLLKISRLLQA